MDFFEVIKAASEAAGVPEGLFKSLPAERWDKVSINGSQTATVTAHGIGMKAGRAWTYFTFQSDAAAAVHTLWGSADAAGHTSISLADGQHDDNNTGDALANARIILQPIVTMQGIKVSVRFKFQNAGGQAQVYRFDGRSWP